MSDLLTVLFLLTSEASFAGKKEAMKYFINKGTKSQQIRSPQSVPQPSMGEARLLGVSVGALVSAKSYQWMGDDLSGWNFQAHYRPTSQGYFARSYQLEYQKFSDNNEDLSKVSFLFSLSFPRRLSFPVYLGIAAGPGFFFKQRQGESELTFDYKAYLGFRLNQTHSQYFVQSGVKNHVHMLSDGQFIGWFVSSGVAYKF